MVRSKSLEAIANAAGQGNTVQHKFESHNVVRAIRNVPFEESFPAASAEDVAEAKAKSGFEFPISAGEQLIILQIIETGDGVPYLVGVVGDTTRPPSFAPENALELVSAVYEAPNRSDGLKIGSTLIAQRDLTMRDIFGDRGAVMELIEGLRSMTGKSEYLIKTGEAGQISEFDPFDENSIVLKTEEVPSGAPVKLSDFVLA